MKREEKKEEQSRRRNYHVLWGQVFILFHSIRPHSFLGDVDFYLLCALLKARPVILAWLEGLSISESYSIRHSPYLLLFFIRPLASDILDLTVH